LLENGHENVIAGCSSSLRVSIWMGKR